ncbi:MAG: phosphoribosylglycinamide formyltransferase [Candidatus Delongbacteria bacterium]|nr:phosphoribosylglycinamide formyltransferase [Candidatus Delongbacteria bacterium]MBN2836102.1 phosphoribosylglycinamide formyltransferase [Candidatus Delongbacteria bacterium]
MGWQLRKFNICVYISGSGSNLKSILENIDNKTLNSNVSLVISSCKNAGGMKFSIERSIPTFYLNRKELSLCAEEFASKQLELLKENNIDLIVLAGYLKKLSKRVIREYKGKIINIHPALLPNYGGKEMYGMNVHRAVFANGDKISGPTVHFVDEIYDNGETIIQRSVDISECKSPEEIQKTVLKVEHQVYTEAIKLLESKID